MRGELIYARSIERASISGRDGGATWQYHSRSDLHGKFAVLAILFDLLADCSLLRQHAVDGKVGFGLNHEMNDFRSGRRKKLDLVICRCDSSGGGQDWVDYALGLGMAFTPEELGAARELPSLQLVAGVRTALLAIEAKACMTEHIKAIPRLHDELSSSFQAINGDTNETIAVASVTVNTADEFKSPVRRVTAPADEFRSVPQPRATERVIKKVAELRRRSGPTEPGFDAIGVTLLNFRNDGGPVALIPPDGEYDVPAYLTYSAMVSRVSQVYSARFARL